MTLSKEEAAELRSDITAAKKRAVNFAVCVGKKPETTVLLVHKIKGPEILEKQAKSAGDTSKTLCGVMNVKSKDMMLTCADAPPSGTAKKVRDFLKVIGLKMKVLILDAAGETLEADGEDETGDDAPGAPVEDAANPDEDRWLKAAKNMAPAVLAAMKSPDGDAGKLRAMWSYAQETAGEGNYVGALKVLARIAPLLKAPGTQATPTDGNQQGIAPTAPMPASSEEQPPDPNAAKWREAEKKASELFRQAMATDPADRTRLQAAWAMAVEAAADGNYANALKVLARLVPALQKAVDEAGKATSDDPAGAAATAIPKNVVAFQKARVLWSDTRKKMMSEMKKLEDEIISVCSGREELAPVAADARSLSKRLEVFDAKLEDILDAITNSEEGERREKLKAAARKQIGTYAAALNEDFFKDVDGNNGFANVAVAGTARASLQQIAKAIA